jgi:hypothetical protein
LHCHDARAAPIDVFDEALDGAALAGDIARREQDDDAMPGLVDPAGHLRQPDLQA